MESIFHEKQEGFLCAQHCLNALLQSSYFDAVYLSYIADEMDEEERKRMAESGIDSEEYRLFLQQPSGNMDDSGYFSVQVISSALKLHDLELVPYNSTEPAAVMAQSDPSQMKAYICNYKGHWFTIRKLGNQWFNLNSMLNGPQLISDTYLAMFLTQLIIEGYSIFVVVGTFPKCEADDVLLKNPVIPSMKVKQTETKTPATTSTEYRLGSSTIPSEIINRDHDYNSTSTSSRERIIPIKVEGREPEEIELDGDDEDLELQKALKLSLQDNQVENRNGEKKSRVNFNTEVQPVQDVAQNLEKEEELQKALRLSLECVTAPSTPDLEDLRWKRLNYLTSRGTPISNTEAPTLQNT